MILIQHLNLREESAQIFWTSSLIMINLSINYTVEAINASTELHDELMLRQKILDDL